MCFHTNINIHIFTALKALPKLLHLCDLARSDMFYVSLCVTSHCSWCLLSLLLRHTCSLHNQLQLLPQPCVILWLAFLVRKWFSCFPVAQGHTSVRTMHEHKLQLCIRIHRLWLVSSAALQAAGFQQELLPHPLHRSGPGRYRSMEHEAWQFAALSFAGVWNHIWAGMC